MRAADVLLSVIIVNYKTVRLTLECVRSIYDFPPSCRFEVVVLDNGSNPELDGALAERFPEARFIETGENLGFAKANNLWICNSHGKRILLLNSDARFTAGCA